jgi:threonine dehydratase
MCIKAVELRGPSIHFVTAAGINTCLAVAYSARQLNVEATIVLPKIVNQKIFDMIKLDGANLIMLGEVSQITDRQQQLEMTWNLNMRVIGF